MKTSEKLISVLYCQELTTCLKGSNKDRKIIQECIEEVKVLEVITKKYALLIDIK